MGRNGLHPFNGGGDRNGSKTNPQNSITGTRAPDRKRTAFIPATQGPFSVVRACRRKKHIYNADLKECPFCYKIRIQKIKDKNKPLVALGACCPVKICRKKLHVYSALEKECMLCKKANEKKYYLKNKKRIKKYYKTWLEANRKKVKEKQKIWRRKNPKKLTVYSRKWRRKNKGHVNFLTSSYQCKKKNAIPPWANMSEIKNIYKKAKEITEATGIEHHVDHIYPLSSKYLCGLHVETNLQIITKKENVSKGNRFWPGQLDCQKD
jgi:hypothetical protein